MYQFAYAEAMETSPSHARDNERAAFDRSVALLEQAEAKGRFSHEAVEAITFTRRLWSIVIDDLAHPENRLADELKANIISIASWIIKETDRIMKRETLNFRGIIDITNSLRAGLA